MNHYLRPQAAALYDRLLEPPRWLQIIAGPRRVGKTTLVRAVLARIEAGRSRYISVDAVESPPVPSPASLATSLSDGTGYTQSGTRRDAEWLVRQWQEARELARRADGSFVLAIDEIQKIPRWSDTVKGLWDADRRDGLSMHVVLLGSSPLLVQSGLSESLMGRFELIRLGHWSYPEMHAAFGIALDEYLYFGGYPEPADTGLFRSEDRWRRHVIDSLIEPTIDQDVLALTRVDRQPLLKQLFWLGSGYSGQILGLDNMAQNLHEKGERTEAHTGTIAKYLGLLGKAGLLASLQKYSGSQLRQRTSSPKLLALNNAFIAVASGYDFAAAKADRSFWGRLTESAAGAHLYNSGDPDTLYYWRKSNDEVDFILARGRQLTAIEVKSGRQLRGLTGLDKFCAQYPDCRRLLVGEGGIPLVEFLSHPADHWLSASW